MDYSKVKYVKPSVDGIIQDSKEVYLTEGKVYDIQGEVEDSGLCYIVNDTGRKNLILIPGCAHLDDAPWIPCTKDGTPL